MGSQGLAGNGVVVELPTRTTAPPRANVSAENTPTARCHLRAAEASDFTTSPRRLQDRISAGLHTGGVSSETHDSSSNFRQVVDLLSDRDHDRRARKLRLQGFRGTDLTRVRATGPAASLGPATCGLVSAVIAITGSALLAAVLAVTALVGVFVRNHPIELLHNRIARCFGRPEIPSSRAAKRFACSLGASFLMGAAMSYALGADGWALGFALTMTVVPLFVAASGICVPSLLFSLALGTEAATAPTLRSSLTRQPRAAYTQLTGG